MPRTYDPEFRRRVLELVKAGRPVRVIAAELGLAEATVYRWKAQDLIDRWVKPGTSTSEQGELAACLPTSTGTATNSAGSTPRVGSASCWAWAPWTCTMSPPPP